MPIAERLQIWLRADEGIVFTTEKKKKKKNAITKWRDVSGHNRDAIAATPQSMPHLVQPQSAGDEDRDHDIGGARSAVVRFDGIDDTLLFPGSFELNGDWQILILARYTASGSAAKGRLLQSVDPSSDEWTLGFWMGSAAWFTGSHFVSNGDASLDASHARWRLIEATSSVGGALLLCTNFAFFKYIYERRRLIGN
jgi:hypothetical protein